MFHEACSRQLWRGSVSGFRQTFLEAMGLDVGFRDRGMDAMPEDAEVLGWLG